MVALQHPASIRTVYLHLRGFARGIKAGRRVKQGQVLGRVGNSGMPTAPHLHLAFRDAGGTSIRPRFTIETRTPRSRKWKRIDGADLREGLVGRNLPRYERTAGDDR